MPPASTSPGATTVSVLWGTRLIPARRTSWGPTTTPARVCPPTSAALPPSAPGPSSQPGGGWPPPPLPPSFLHLWSVNHSHLKVGLTQQWGSGMGEPLGIGTWSVGVVLVPGLLDPIALASTSRGLGGISISLVCHRCSEFMLVGLKVCRPHTMHQCL